MSYVLKSEIVKVWDDLPCFPSQIIQAEVVGEETLEIYYWESIRDS